MNRKAILLAIGALTLALALPAQADQADQPDQAAAHAAAKTWTTIRAWPMAGCVVSGRALEEGKAKTFEAAGRTFQTCCGRCQKKVEESPDEYVAKLDEAIRTSQLATYPLETCPLTGRELGDKAENVILGDTLVRVCCGRCAKKAPEKSAELVAAVEAAAHEQQAASYPLKTCPVSGEELGAKPVEVMYGTTLVRFCGDACVETFRASPQEALAAVRKARAGAAGSDEKPSDAGAEKGDAEKRGAKSGAKGDAKGDGQDGACCSGSTCCAEPKAGSAKTR